MMTTLFEETFSESAVEEALEDLEKKNDSCGVDGVLLSELREYWTINHERILEKLMSESYEPGIVRETEIINGKGKNRQIALYNSVDRLILRCMSQKIQAEYDSLLDSHCFAFRTGYGVEAAIKVATDYVNENLTWVVKIDVKDYYDSISIVKMQDMVRDNISDAPLRRLISKYLYPEVVREDGSFFRKEIGIVQGSPISPFLSNLYLMPFDKELGTLGLSFCRFADDICIFFRTKEEASGVYPKVLNKLRDVYGLHHNKEKSGIFSGLNQEYLEYTFLKDKQSGRITAVKKQKIKFDVYYNSWNRNVIQKIDRDYHIINEGILSKKDYNVLFENKSGKKYMPVEMVRAANIHSNVTFSSDFFRFAGQKRLDINIFDKYGNYVGSFVPADNGYRSKMLLQQVKVYLDESKRTQVAKAMEIGSLHNIRANLRYYYKHKKTDSLKAAVDKLSEYISDINSCKTVNDMMLIEARARELYYKAFNEIISNDRFAFNTRTRMPPKDPINALISFGNVYLYNRIATEINKTTMDIRIGFVHSVTRRNQSLNLDIADIFKPIIVDRAIFSVINLKMIDAEAHFEYRENGAVYLNNVGKRLFLNALRDKIYEKQTVDNKPVSYDTRIRDEVSKVYRYILYEEKYKPYKYQ